MRCYVDSYFLAVLYPMFTEVRFMQIERTYHIESILAEYGNRIKVSEHRIEDLEKENHHG